MHFSFYHIYDIILFLIDNTGGRPPIIQIKISCTLIYNLHYNQILDILIYIFFRSFHKILIFLKLKLIWKTFIDIIKLVLSKFSIWYKYINRSCISICLCTKKCPGNISGYDFWLWDLHMIQKHKTVKFKSLLLFDKIIHLLSI